jgi:hypothetical protein
VCNALDNGAGVVRVLRGHPAGVLADAAPRLGPRCVRAPYTRANVGGKLR